MHTAILRDLTEYKRLQRELAQSQKLESIGQLAAGVSHEINTPMQFIGDNVEYLNECLEGLFAVIAAYEENLEGAVPRSWQERARHVADVKEQTRFNSIRQDVVKAVEESLDGVRRVVQIVRAMKQFSHLGTEEKVATDLNEAIRSTVTITKNRWKYVAEMDLQLDPDLPPLQSFPAELNQVLLNLVVNSADAIAEKLGDLPEEKGRITIRSRTEESDIVIDVEDTGCGIPEEIAGQIFNPFFTTKEVGKGTGQGLTICHDVVVNNHQGRIGMQSKPGAGSTFTIRLPMPAATGYAPRPELADALA
jgi:signal transduction histidine kinase